MNFYSDKIINNIIDNDPLDTILDTIECFEAHYAYLIVKYSISTISYKYTQNLLKDKNNIIAFHCMDNDFLVDNCPSMLIYQKRIFKNEIRYYILFTCTKRKFRGQGYASKLIDGFIERIKTENTGERTVKIILSSVENSVLFYEEYGFKWTRESILNHSILLKFESYEKKKYYYIMELVVFL